MIMSTTDAKSPGTETDTVEPTERIRVGEL
jgi:hypothetical protein